MKKKDHIRIVSHPEKLSSYWKQQPLLCLFIILSGTLYNFGMLAGPYFQGLLIDEISSPENTFSSVLRIVLLYVLVILSVQFFRALKRYFVRRFANNAMTSMRINLFNNILSEKTVDLEKEDKGKLLTRSESDVNESVEGMRKLTTEIFDTLLLFLFYILYLFVFDSKMTAIALIFVSLAILFAFSFRKSIYRFTSESRKENAKVSSVTYDLVENALLYRIYSRDEDNLKDYDKELKEYEKRNIRSELIANMVVPVSNVIALLGLIPILYLGIEDVNNASPLSLPLSILTNDHWTIGLFTTYLSTFILLGTKASHTAKLFSSVEKGLCSWKRISPYMKPYQEYPKATVLPVEKGLEVKNVSLVLPDQEVLLKPFSFQAKKSEIICITGPIASGKSLFGKVFLQEYPYQGSILLFGKEVREYSENDIKGNIVYMGHASELFSSTIKANIAFENEEDIRPYLHLVSFDEDLTRMPEKENTLIGNQGVKLSGGQQERIALARTFYHKKNLIILDDPFASVDSNTEREIMRNLKEEAKDSILLLFSHRLSYFPYADQVICFNKDRTVSCGTHASLLEADSTYQGLFSLQKKEDVTL